MRWPTRAALKGLCAASVSILLVGLASCSEAPKPVGQGGACALTTDCDIGLFCVPQSNGGRICTGDVTSISKPTQPPPSGDAAAADAGDGGEAGPRDGGGGTDAPSDSPITPPEDSGTPPVDAAVD